MPGLVEEIQAQSLDPGVRVSDLLRKVKLAAVKLKLSDTVDWVSRELAGYPNEIEVPEYRVSSGQLMMHSFHHGTRRATGDPRMIAALSVVTLREPLGNLETLLEADGETFSMPVDADVVEAINQVIGGSNQALLVYFGKNTVNGVIDSVRNMVLDWAANLEQEGILGEGISFTPAEKEKAIAAAPSIHIGSFSGNFHQGDISGNQNRSYASSVDRSVNTLETETTFEQLNAAIRDFVVETSDKEVLLEIVSQLQGAIGTPAFATWYQRLIASAADHMTVIQPFLPGLTAML